MDATYEFRFTFDNNDGEAVEHKFEATTAGARERWADALQIAEVTGSTNHRAWFHGQPGQRWIRWK